MHIVIKRDGIMEQLRQVEIISSSVDYPSIVLDIMKNITTTLFIFLISGAGALVIGGEVRGIKLSIEIPLLLASFLERDDI